MKLSKVQLDIIKKMDNGWELGFHPALYSSCSLQQGGQGKGGIYQKVKINTFMVLCKEKLIFCSKHGYPTEKYSLTEKAKALI